MEARVPRFHQITTPSSRRRLWKTKSSILSPPVESKAIRKERRAFLAPKLGASDLGSNKEQ